MRTRSESDEQLCTLGKIITFNGQGCSGKGTQSKRLAKLYPEKCKRVHGYELRRNFRDEIYNQLGRKDECITYSSSNDDDKLYNVEVLGIPSITWLTACFHLKVKPLQENYIVVLDHYIGDFYADMLECFDPSKFQRFVKDHLGMPDFNQGIHFYLDIDYKTYEHRWYEREKREPDVPQNIFKKRHERYQRLCELTSLRYIDATMSKCKVAEEIQKEVREFSL